MHAGDKNKKKFPLYKTPGIKHRPPDDPAVCFSLLLDEAYFFSSAASGL